MIAVVAADLDWGIGCNGKLLCRLSGDMKRFRELTMGKPVIYGRKTLETFPGGKPLPGRRNMILTHNQNLKVDGAECFHDIDTLLVSMSLEELCSAAVIGGGQVYHEMFHMCSSIYVTRLLDHFKADRFFSPLDLFQLAGGDGPYCENGVLYRFDRYDRKF